MNYTYDELSKIICYPRYDLKISQERINYLREKRVILFKYGKSMINNCNILGKGHAGIVIKGIIDDEEVAVKIRRMDSKRDSLLYEGKMLELANNIGIGPKLYYATDDIIIMEYIDGISVKEFLERYNDINIIREILEQSFRLDCINLDHGELSNMNKHVIINKDKVTIIDFDSASINRRASNVTSTAQYLLNYLQSDKDEVFYTLRRYKHCICRNCFDDILKALKVK